MRTDLRTVPRASDSVSPATRAGRDAADATLERPNTGHPLQRPTRRTLPGFATINADFWTPRVEHASPGSTIPALPILFKPLGCPLPESHYIASDADFVDYLTELMGGFGIPPFIKHRRHGLRYLLLGMALDRDTERMLIDGFVQGAADPAGWALLSEATQKASRFLVRQNIERIESKLSDWLRHLGKAVVQTDVVPESAA